MAITFEQPRTIYLGGQTGEPAPIVNHLAVSESVTPGMLVELFNSSGTMKYRKHASAAGLTTKAIALNQPHMNKGVDDAYATGDLVEVMIGQAGCTFWMLVASGANITQGDRLESAGNGKLKAATTGAMFTALETVNNSAGPSDARIRVECM